MRHVKGLGVPYVVMNGKVTTAKPLLSASQIAKGKNLPPRLTAIGREIEAKVSKFQTYETKAADMVVSIRQLLAEAAKYCDKGGFNAFRKKFCPSLGRSRAYELLAIASGKKTTQEVKANKGARQARYIDRLKKAASRPSLTDDSNVVRLLPHGDNTVREFDKHALELVLMTVTVDPSRFASTTVPAGDLEALATFLMAVEKAREPVGKLRSV
jgi:hypothetical protein